MTVLSCPSPVKFEVADACQQAVGRAPAVTGTGDPVELVFDPDLSASELTAITDILASQRTRLTITLAEYQAIKPDIVTLRAFRTRTGSPSNAQVLDAIDSIIDVLRALLRD